MNERRRGFDRAHVKRMYGLYMEEERKGQNKNRLTNDHQIFRHVEEFFFVLGGRGEPFLRALSVFSCSLYD
jgi:hypothetical protein